MVRYIVTLVFLLFAFEVKAQQLFDAYFDNGEEQDKKLQQINENNNEAQQPPVPAQERTDDDIDDAYSPSNDTSNEQIGYQPQVIEQSHGNFKAYTEKQSVASEQPFEIIMELVNADAYSAPDTSVFPSELKIQTQSQQTSVSIVNGVSAKNTKWILEVIAESPGAYAVPPISIQTDIGTLYSNSFNIYAKDVGDLPANTEDNTVFIEASIGKKEIAVGEPVEYKVKVYHLHPIEMPELVKPKSDDLKIEQITEPNKGQEQLNGSQYNTLEVSFLVTPLVSGKVKVEPSILRGKILKEVKRKRPRTAFDDFFDPFAVIDSAFSVTREMEDFTVASNKIALDIKPKVEGVDPWLALYDLEISDELTDLRADANAVIKAKVGEPISRKIVFTAIGRKGDELPDIERYIDAKDFKIYSDKPQSEQKILTAIEGPIAAKIKGVKSQSFTFIPEKTGELVIPEIKVAYYSIPEDKVKYAVLPGKKLDVEKGRVSYVDDQQKPDSEDKEETSSEGDDEIQETSGLKYLVLLLLAVILFLIYKIYNLKNGGAAVASSSEKVADLSIISRKINDDNSIKATTNSVVKDSMVVKELKISENFKMLEKAIKKFGMMKLAIPENTSVTIVGQQVARHYKLNRSEVVRLCADLDAAIYTNKDVNFESLKNGLVKIFSKVEDKDMDKALKKKKKLTPLNPT